MTTDSHAAANPESAAFAHAYDVRRSARAANQQAVNNLVDDHAPTCPRCDDLLPHGATYCAECGCKVTV